MSTGVDNIAGVTNGVTKNFQILVQLLGEFYSVKEMSSEDQTETHVSALATEVNQKCNQLLLKGCMYNML